MSTSEKPTQCPCDPTRRYLDCCGRYHDGAPAPTAEALMRSRYSAFALRLSDYLVRTWHPRTRPGTLDLDDDTTWTRLRIQHTELGLPGEASGVVEFTASWRSGSQTGELHEVSRFEWRANRWLYLDGQVD